MWCGHPVVVVLVCTECCRSSAESLTELAGGSRELRGEDCLLLRRERREERESTQLILCHKHSTDLLPYREFFTKRIFYISDVTEISDFLHSGQELREKS